MPVPVVLFHHVACIPKERMAQDESSHDFERNPPMGVSVHKPFFVDNREEIKDEQQSDGKKEEFDVPEIRDGPNLLEIEKRMEDLFSLRGGALLRFVDESTNLEHENAQYG